MKPLKYRLANGETVYSLRVFIGTTSEGKKIIKSKKWQPDKKYTPNQLEKELQKQILQFEKEVKQGTVIDDDITFKEFSEIWIEKYSRLKHKLKTIDSYESMLKRINIAIGNIKLSKLNTITINSFLGNLKEAGTKLTDKNKQACLSDKSVKNYYVLISSILTIAKKWSYIKNNPMDNIDTPKVLKHQVQALEKADVDKLFELLMYEPLKYQLFITLAIFSGARRGEMLGLKWSAIDFHYRLIRIDQTSQYVSSVGIYEDTTKSESSNRTLKLSDVVFDLFLRHKEEQEKDKERLEDLWVDNDYVFTKWNGEPMYPNTPYDWFNKFQKKHNLQHCSIHALRHTSATLLIMKGVNIKAVSGRLGHADTGTTTNIYASYLQTADAMVAEALDNVLCDNK